MGCHPCNCSGTICQMLFVCPQQCSHIKMHEIVYFWWLLSYSIASSEHPGLMQASSKTVQRCELQISLLH